MMRCIWTIAGAIAFGVAARAQAGPEVEIVPAFPNLAFVRPVDIQDPHDGTNRLFVVQQIGLVTVFENDPDAMAQSIFLDMQFGTTNMSEEGFTGIAFHPDFKSDGYFYLSRTVAGDNARSIFSRFEVSDSDPNMADPASEMVLLEIAQPFLQHNAHRMAFGPDGYLYIAAGDGGGFGDPNANGQDRTTLRSTILRIDVDATSPGLNYAVPPGNPFVGNMNGWHEEIYAWGMRNPWRMSFDNSGRLWVGDVGESSWEEIDWIMPGANYGWSIMEGAHCFPPEAKCDVTGITLPVFEYPHGTMVGTGNAVTGGFVYEGVSCPRLRGRYVFTDFTTSPLWALTFDDAGVIDDEIVIDDMNIRPAVTGVDRFGELYIADYLTGEMFRVVCPGALGDLNDDDAVNLFDLLALLGAWGPATTTAGFAADLDNNGDVNVFDLLTLLSQWGAEADR